MNGAPSSTENIFHQEFMRIFEEVRIDLHTQSTIEGDHLPWLLSNPLEVCSTPSVWIPRANLEFHWSSVRLFEQLML